MINELLLYGANNPRTGRELAMQLNCDVRTVTEQIERERRSGVPICATVGGENSGYFLAETTEELERYCNRLNHRANEMFKTHSALLKVLEPLKQQKEIEKHG